MARPHRAPQKRPAEKTTYREKHRASVPSPLFPLRLLDCLNRGVTVPATLTMNSDGTCNESQVGYYTILTQVSNRFAFDSRYLVHIYVKTFHTSDR